MNPNRETIRIAATALTNQQFTCWSLSQAGYSQHRIAITTGLTRRTIRDHLAAAEHNLARALANGETHTWPDTQVGSDTPTNKPTSARSPSSSSRPTEPSSNPEQPPAATPKPSEESPPSAPTSPEPSPAPTPKTEPSKENEPAPNADADYPNQADPASVPVADGSGRPLAGTTAKPPAPAQHSYAPNQTPQGVEPHEEREMTAYGDRRRAGEYDAPDADKAPRESTVHDPTSGGTTIQIDPEETTLKELQDQAESLGLPTYGTKAQLAERIANA